MKTVKLIKPSTIVVYDGVKYRLGDTLAVKDEEAEAWVRNKRCVIVESSDEEE